KRFLFDEANRSAVILLLITRLVPLFPYNLQNFAYGITEIPLIPYTLYTFFFMAPGVALFTIGTTGFTSEDRQMGYLILALVLFVMVLLLGRWIKHRYVDSKEMHAND
ncbi:MAG: TVP38/TMEM64 family protein, partial [Oscillospiraceae bacterium]|nr:TVP38/TMEM64 family protein [Oscillospiraceae bacterium]